jgi:YbbR domain-containing protein
LLVKYGKKEEEFDIAVLTEGFYSKNISVTSPQKLSNKLKISQLDYRSFV